jgi:PhnB protein
MAPKSVPEGFHTITPSLACKNAAEAIRLYENAFGAVERSRMAGPDGRVMHAELLIGNSTLFLADEYPGMSAAPAPGSLPSQSLFLYVDDVDAVFQRAVASGCRESMPVTDMFWGDRYGKVIDPFGHHWGLATHVEDVAPAEMERRAKEWMAKMASSAKAAGQS